MQITNKSTHAQQQEGRKEERKDLKLMKQQGAEGPQYKLLQ